MAKKVQKNINQGVMIGDMLNSFAEHNTEPDDRLKECIAIILKDYSPAEQLAGADMALTTATIQAQIASFCGIESTEKQIYEQMTEGGFEAKFGDSVELALPKNFYWIFKKR